MPPSSSLPYALPPLPTLLTQSTFLLSLNLLNSLFDRLLNCGLVGQILLGIAWGTPGGGWLDEAAETVFVQLGYLGLIFVVYEGGLTLSLPSLRTKHTLPLSIAVALTGISLPIALSFAVLPSLIPSTAPLRSFAAGAALCSTSLGTTFTVLSSCGLTQTRLGVVLASAAMMDDVVGLVAVRVIEELRGGKGGSVDVVTVVRPVCVSLGFAVAAPVGCVVVGRMRRRVRWVTRLFGKVSGRCATLFSRQQVAFACHTLFLLGMVTDASYAGTSDLFAAYIAGAVVSWWDGAVPETVGTDQGRAAETDGALEAGTGMAVYKAYYQSTVERVLRPLFFASIGFSIPVSQMFPGRIVWRGLIYALLMAFGKLLCGMWLLRVPLLSTLSSSFRTFLSKLSTLLRMARITSFLLRSRGSGSNDRASKQKAGVAGTSNDFALREIAKTTSSVRKETEEVAQQPKAGSSEISPTTRQHSIQSSSGQQDASHLNEIGQQLRPPATEQATNSDSALEHDNEDKDTPSPLPSISASTDLPHPPSQSPPQPLSLYPALLLGTAMIARGEIGFLISSIANGNGSFGSGTGSSSDNTSDIFLIVTWAILLCTIGGPVGVGWLVRRVRNLERQCGPQVEGPTGSRDEMGAAGEDTTPGAAVGEGGRRKRYEVLGEWGVG